MHQSRDVGSFFIIFLCPRCSSVKDEMGTLEEHFTSPNSDSDLAFFTESVHEFKRIQKALEAVRGGSCDSITCPSHPLPNLCTQQLEHNGAVQMPPSSDKEGISTCASESGRSRTSLRYQQSLTLLSKSEGSVSRKRSILVYRFRAVPLCSQPARPSQYCNT